MFSVADYSYEHISYIIGSECIAIYFFAHSAGAAEYCDSTSEDGLYPHPQRVS